MAPPSPDLYAFIHKTLRLGLSELLIRIGNTDPCDLDAWSRVEVEGHALHDLLLSHSRHEDEFVHPLIRTAAPAVAETLDADHGRLDADVRRMGKALGDLRDVTDPAVRAARARELYLDLSGFVAAYFRHLLVEETQAMPALNRHFPAETLLNTHLNLVGAIPPEEKLRDLPLIVRALTPPERIGLLRATQATAPAAFFEQACRVVRQALGEEAYAAVEQALWPVNV